MADNERRKKLMETVKSFNKKNKEPIFTLGSDIKELDVISTGVPEIDSAIGGGFKKGGHTILYGQYSVGKTALILTTIATAQKNGELVCYVNTEKPIDPERFEFFGIKLNELVYIEAPSNAEQALEAMRTLCKDKVIDLFVIDSVNGLSPKSTQETKEGKERELEKKDIASLPLTLSSFYNKVNAHIFRSRASVVWIGQTRTQGIGTFFVRSGLSGGQAQEFYAYMKIFMRKDSKANNPKAKRIEYFFDPDGKMHKKTVKDDIGFSIVMKMEKTNSCKSLRENQEVIVPYYADTGFFTPEEGNIPITLRGTEEEKEKLTELLIEKGVFESTESKEKIIKEEVPKKKRGRKKKENKK